MQNQPKLLPAPGWFAGAAARMRVLWIPKMAGTVGGMTAFFVVYFWLLNHSRSPVTTVPRIFVDRLVGFSPSAVALYVSLWVYVPLAPALLTTGRELRAYLAAAAAMSLVGFGIFVLWPTTIPKPEFDPALYPSMAYLKTVDASGNAFPSLHVAFAVFTVLWLGRVLHETRAGMALGILNWVWCIGIVYSTLAIRQHVALDAFAGIILGAAVAALHMGLLRGRPIPSEGP
jgi:membrane-associated phospholipid phosphatase